MVDVHRCSEPPLECTDDPGHRCCLEDMRAVVDARCQRAAQASRPTARPGLVAETGTGTPPLACCPRGHPAGLLSGRGGRGPAEGWTTTHHGAHLGSASKLRVNSVASRVEAPVPVLRGVGEETGTRRWLLASSWRISRVPVGCARFPRYPVPDTKSFDGAGKALRMPLLDGVGQGVILVFCRLKRRHGTCRLVCAPFRGRHLPSRGARRTTTTGNSHAFKFGAGGG